MQPPAAYRLVSERAIARAAIVVLTVPIAAVPRRHPTARVDVMRTGEWTAKLQTLSRARLGVVARVVLAAVTVGWLGRTIHPKSVVLAWRGLPTWSVLASFVCMLLSVAFAAHRWGLLVSLASGRPTPPFATSFRTTLEALFLNNLPSGLAGEAVRAARVRSLVGGGGTSLAIVVVDRFAGLAGLFLTSAVALLGASTSTADPRDEYLRRFVLGGAFAMGLAIVTVVVARRRLRNVRGIGRVVTLTEGRLGTILLLSTATQVTIATSIAVLLWPLTPETPPFDLLRVAPLVMLAVFIPLTPAAIGQRELAFSQLFGLVGVRPPLAVASSLVWFALGIAISLMGAASLAVGGRAR